jgi:hypothetical protein
MKSNDDYKAALNSGTTRIYPWLYSPILDLVRFFSFLVLYTVGMTP